MVRDASADPFPSSRGHEPVSGSCIAHVCTSLMIATVSAILMSVDCRPISAETNPVSTEEKYYLVGEVYLSPGSAYSAKEVFDHDMNDVINLCFTPRNEKNHYVVRTIWYDPAGQEYRSIRRTYDIVREGRKAVAPRRQGKGTPRVISVSVAELYAHKPGRWRVDLYLDGELAKKLEFTVR
jgi:hypothetical protein